MNTTFEDRIKSIPLPEEGSLETLFRTFEYLQAKGTRSFDTIRAISPPPKNGDGTFGIGIFFVFDAEGGLSNDVNDSGGLTKYGITKMQYPSLDIANLTKQQAQDIYRRDYWNACHCEELPEQLAVTVFDTAVNCGVGSAIRWLQESCNEFNVNTIPVDGGMGSRTLSGVLRTDKNKLLLAFMSHRINRYTDLVDRKPSQLKFLQGWMRRVSNILLYGSHLQ